MLCDCTRMHAHTYLLWILGLLLELNTFFLQLLLQPFRCVPESRILLPLGILQFLKVALCGVEIVSMHPWLDQSLWREQNMQTLRRVTIRFNSGE